MKRRILYVTGTRADFGLMARSLKAMNDDEQFELKLLVTGMHLSPVFGNTVHEIEASGLKIAAEVPVNLSLGSGAGMARNLGEMIVAFTTAMEREKPDIVLLLGDRGEMLAAAISAIHQNFAIVHIHGGERSGTVDEPIRHAISKLAHFHFTSTDDARRRLIRMGERYDRVWTVGAPGLDELSDNALRSRADLLGSLKLDPERPLALLVHHPVVQDAHLMKSEAEAVLTGLVEARCQVVALNPNSDAGGAYIRNALQAATTHSDIRLITHFPRRDFISWMAIADLMIGNSSAGIIEAASFGTPVINIGSRQNLRERNFNVTDVTNADQGLSEIILDVLAKGRLKCENVYGDGASSPRIVALLASIPLDSENLRKYNAY